MKKPRQEIQRLAFPTPDQSPTTFVGTTKRGTTNKSAQLPSSSVGFAFSPSTQEGSIQAVRINTTNFVFVLDENKHLHGGTPETSQDWTELVPLSVQKFQAIAGENFVYLFVVPDTQDRLLICRFERLAPTACQLELHLGGIQVPQSLSEFRISDFHVVAPYEETNPLNVMHLALSVGKPAAGASTFSPELYVSAIPFPSKESQVNPSEFRQTSHNGLFGDWAKLPSQVSQASKVKIRLAYVSDFDSDIPQGNPFSNYTIVLFALFDNPTSLYRFYTLFDPIIWRPVSNSPFTPNDQASDFHPSDIFVTSHPRGCSVAVIINRTPSGAEVLSFEPKKHLRCQRGISTQANVRDLFKFPTAEFEFVGQFSRAQPNFKGKLTREGEFVLVTKTGTGKLEQKILDSLPVRPKPSPGASPNPIGLPAENKIGLPYEDQHYLGEPKTKSIDGLRVETFDMVLDESGTNPVVHLFAIGKRDTDTENQICHNVGGSFWNCFQKATGPIQGQSPSQGTTIQRTTTIRSTTTTQ